MPSILEDWTQEGPNDPVGDEQLVDEALAVLQQHEDRPDDWMSWELFETDLSRSEAACELPE